MMELKDKFALITGASGAIGGAISEALADRGARLVLAGRDRERLDALAERLRGRAPEIDVQATDLGDEAKLRRLAARVLSSFGGVDLLIHSAGVWTAGTVEAGGVEDLDRQLRLNLRVPYLLTQLLLPSLKARHGQIAFINSSAAKSPRGPIAAYATSKAALKAFADCLRAEVGAAGVRVLSVFPGRTASAMQEEVCRAEGSSYDPARFIQPAEVARAVVAALSLGPSAELTELDLRPAHS